MADSGYSKQYICIIDRRSDWSTLCDGYSFIDEGLSMTVIRTHPLSRHVRGRLWTLGLVCVVLISFIPSATADLYVRNYYDGDWYDTAILYKWIEGGAVVEGYGDVDEGKLDLHVSCVAFGVGEVEGTVEHEFLYTGSTGYNWIKVSYKPDGYLFTWEPDDGGSIARFWVKVELWHQGTRLRKVTDIEKELDSSIIPKLWHAPPYRTIKFKCYLENGETYRLDFVANAYAVALGAAEATVDFMTYDNVVDLHHVRVWHQHDSTMTRGGVEEGDTVHGEWDIKQKQQYTEQLATADKLSFTSYNNDREIDGWKVITYDQRHSASDWAPGDPYEVDVQAWGADIPKNEWVHVDVTQWVDSWNAMGIKGVEWENTGGLAQTGIARAIPDHHWSIGYPQAIPWDQGKFRHTFIMRNDDLSDTLRVGALSFLDTMFVYTSPSEADYDGGTFEFDVPPGSLWTSDVVTDGHMEGGYIYFKYSLYDSAKTDVICNAWGGHPILDGTATHVSQRPPRLVDTWSYPNPFRTSTTITFSTRYESPVTLTIYDVAGRRVRTLVNEPLGPGSHRRIWDGNDNSGRRVASGVYFYRLSTGTHYLTKKIVRVE